MLIWSPKGAQFGPPLILKASGQHRENDFFHFFIKDPRRISKMSKNACFFPRLVHASVSEKSLDTSRGKKSVFLRFLPSRRV